MKKFYSTLIAAVALSVLATPVFAAAPPIISLQTVLDAVTNLQTKLDQIPPAWSQTLPAAQRFVVVMGGAAVLDKETGVVWEKSPDGSSANFVDAQVGCNVKALGNRKGWRVPTVYELASLIDTSNPAGNPDLPVGHPFTNVQSSIYWSATTDAGDSNFGWEVNLFFGNSAGGPERMVKSSVNFVWCMRGGLAADPK
jgi:hypothetical protein